MSTRNHKRANLAQSGLTGPTTATKRREAENPAKASNVGVDSRYRTNNRMFQGHG
jgi:hypothetical protein